MVIKEKVCEMTEEQKIILDDFLLHINELDELDEFTNKDTIFDILGSVRSELKHSNVLAWLLDANGSHGLGKEVIQKLIIKIAADGASECEIMDWSFLDYTTQKVIREWHPNKENSLDILITFCNEGGTIDHVLAIENKIDSNEGDSQTLRYSKELEKAFSRAKIIKVFLSPYSKVPEDETWYPMSYSTMVDIIEAVDTNQMEDVKRILIEDYKRVIRRDIMTDDLVEICTKIYNNNREALDLIFTNKEDLASKFATYLKDALVELANEEDHVVIYKDDYDSGNTFIRFRYTELDKYLPMSPDQNNDVWKKNNKDEVQKTRYFFEIHPIELKTNEEKCPMYLTICRNNLSDDDESLNNAKKIIGNTFNKIKKLKTIYKETSCFKEAIDILNSSGSFEMDENDEKKMKEIIKVAIKEYLEKRKKEFEKQSLKPAKKMETTLDEH